MKSCDMVIHNLTIEPKQCFCVVLACHQPVLDGLNQLLIFFCTVHTLCTAVKKSQQHLGNQKKILGALRIGAGAAGQEARMLSPLCHAAPQPKQCLFKRVMSLFRSQHQGLQHCFKFLPMNFFQVKTFSTFPIALNCLSS